MENELTHKLIVLGPEEEGPDPNVVRRVKLNGKLHLLIAELSASNVNVVPDEHPAAAVTSEVTAPANPEVVKSLPTVLHGRTHVHPAPRTTSNAITRQERQRMQTIHQHKERIPGRWNIPPAEPLFNDFHPNYIMYFQRQYDIMAHVSIYVYF